jgi:hypothetical protein
MQQRPAKRYLMAGAGVMPAIAITAGLLTLPETSATRQQYWPWLPLGMLVLGLAFSCFFWLVIIPRRQRKDDGQ